MKGLKNIYHCPLKWEDLNQREHDRYCLSCKKPIQDFTNYSAKEIEEKFTFENLICARVNTQQLNSLSILSSGLIKVILSIGVLQSGNQLFAQKNITTNDSITKHQSIIKKVKIGGKIKDKDTQEPIPFANLFLMCGEKVLSKSTSDLDGNYLFEMNEDSLPNDLSLKCSMIGYRTFEFKNVDTNILRKKNLDLKLDINPETEILGLMIYEPIPENAFPFPSGRTYTRDELNKRPK